MKFGMFKTLIGLALALTTEMHAASAETDRPDIATLSTVADIMGPGSERTKVHASWQNYTKLMTNVDVYDDIASRIMPIICGKGLNKSVLLVGDSADNGYKYIAGRVVAKAAANGCQDTWHVELSATRIGTTSGHVGESETRWVDFVHNPAANKNVVLYSPNFANLLRVGSHVSDPKGLGPTIINSISNGDFRFVAFMSRSDLTEMSSSSSSHFQANLAFAEQIDIPALTSAQMQTFDQAYLATFYPQKILPADAYDYLTNMTDYYQPNISEPKRSLSILESIGKAKASGQITRPEIAEAIGRVARVPMWLIKRDFSRIVNLPQKLSEQVVGIDTGKKDLMTLAQKGYVAGRADGKPIANMMFVGSTGTGKSFLAEKFAELMEMPLVTFDMTSYQNVYTFDNFAKTLAEELQKNPYGVFLFEEIDKADVQVLDRLYMLMDKGIFQDQNQRPLFARGIFVIMTTNAAQFDIIQNKDAPNLQEIVMTTLMETFRPSFINRFDRISIFKPFTAPENKQLAGVLAKQSAKRLKQTLRVEITLDDAALAYVAVNGQDPLMGARPMERLVSEVMEMGISEYALKYGDVPPPGAVQIVKAAGTHEFTLSGGGKDISYSLKR